MKTLYESILDDDDDLLDSTSDVLVDDWMKENITGKYKIKVYKQGYRKNEMKITGDITIKGFTGDSFPSFLNIEKCTGNVIIEKCPNLTSLKGLFALGGGCKNFSINNCPKLISLEGAPMGVEETFTCSGNISLKSLEYAPSVVRLAYIMKNGRKFKTLEIMQKTSAIYVFCHKEENEDIITEENINETLNEPHLLRLAAQLKKYNIIDFRGERISFKSLFGEHNNFNEFGLSIQWDEIDSTNIIELDSSDKYAKKLLDQMMKKLRDFYALLFVLNTDGEYDCVTDGHYFSELPCRVNINQILNNKDEYAVFKPVKKTKEDLKRFLGYGRYVFVVNWGDLNNYQIQGDRAAAKLGMVLQGNPEYYKQVAADNMKRYRDIIKKNRSAHKDKLYIKTSENIKNIIERWQKLTIHVILHPEILATSDYEFSEIATDMGDQMASLGSGRNAYKYQTPGLLNMFSKVCTIYARLLNKLSNTYSDDEQTLQNYINKIEKIISRVDDRLKKFGF